MLLLLGYLNGRSLNEGLRDPLLFLETELDLDLGIFDPMLICCERAYGLVQVSVISYDAVEKSLSLDDVNSLSKDERPEGGKRRIYFMLISADYLLEV